MANKKNKVKFGLTNVHYAKINDWVTDASGANLTPVYVDPVRLPGAVSISIDANGENENFEGYLPIHIFSATLRLSA